MVSNKDLVHYHCHSRHSAQDALPAPEALANKAREMGFPAIALTDHGVMSGIVPFVDACRSTKSEFAPIKPIVGIETYTFRNRTFRSIEGMTDLHSWEMGKKGRPRINHLTLLAQNAKGYENLIKVSSDAADTGFYYKPRTDRSFLQEHAEGVIALSGCLAGEVSQRILAGDLKGAEETMGWYKEVYGDNYYAELQYHDIPDQKIVLPEIISMAKRNNIPLICTNDVHYLEYDDWKPHNVLVQTGSISKTKKEGVDDAEETEEEQSQQEEEDEKKTGKAEAYKTHQFFLKSAKDMLNIFSKYPEALRNSVESSEKIEDYFKLDVPHLLPSVAVPLDNPEFNTFWKQNMPFIKINDAYLAYLAYNGLNKLRLPKDKKQVYFDRLRHEIQQIWWMGVTDYFLIQREMVDFMLSNDILYGLRGSGVGSLVNYCLNICPIDPMKFGLLFERFLNPGRGTQYKVDVTESPSKSWVSENGKQNQDSAVERIKTLFEEKGKDKQYAKHLPEMNKEVWVLENQGLATYICDLADKNIKSEDNDCNLWSAYFFGITDKMPVSGMKTSKTATLPDMDTDIRDDKRDMVIQWAIKRFHSENVIRIGTTNKFGAKAAVRDTLKVSQKFQNDWQKKDASGKIIEDKVVQMATYIHKLIPTRAVPPMTIDEAADLEPEFKVWYDRYPEEMSIAKRLVGAVSSPGVHAAGIVVSSKPVRDIVPVERTKKKNKRTGEMEEIFYSAFDMYSVERVGLVKYDYLGLATYQILARTMEMIEKRHGKKIDLFQMPLDDKNVLRLFSDGYTGTTFQFASSGMRKAIQDVKCDRIEDLIAIVSLFRPGPMQYIKDYAEGKRNPEQVKYIHSVHKKYLEETYGIIVYQEQLMFLVREMAKLDWIEVDKLRKAVSKKQGKEFEECRRLFKDRAMANGYSQGVIDRTQELMEKFAGYAFNKSHATAYAILAYWTGYFRYYYPLEWMANCFQVEHDDDKKVAIYRRECKQIGLCVEKPNINESGIDVVVSGSKRILLPLTILKGVGAQVESLTHLQPFENFRDLIFRGRLNKTIAKALASNGGFDCFSECRSKSYEVIMEMYEETVGERIKEERLAKKIANQPKPKYETVSPFISEEKPEKKLQKRTIKIDRYDLDLF